MLPPPGFTPSLDATSLLSTAIAVATSIVNDLPSSTVSTALTSATFVIPSHEISPQEQPHSPHDSAPGECRLLGPFAILVQGALGCLALLALVYKRWRERPQRPIKIWFFDVSKQVVGSVLVHVANLLMSMLSSGQLSIKLDPSVIEGRVADVDGKYRPNPCSFYLLNLAIDTTIGIPILILLLRIFTSLFAMTPLGQPRESITSGNYGTPPRTFWWFKQSIIYFLGLMGMKTCVLIIFLVLPWISRVGDWALKWTEGDEALQVIFVMLVFPVIMNATQYYIIDSFIKNQKPEHELIPNEDSEVHVPYDPPMGGDGVEEDDDPEVLAKEDSRPSTRAFNSPGKKELKTGNRDYDPLFDGESSPTAIGSASGSIPDDEEPRT